MHKQAEVTRGGVLGAPLALVELLGTRVFSRERPLATLIRLYVAANVAALTIALALGGPGAQAHAAADAVWAWCRVG